MLSVDLSSFNKRSEIENELAKTISEINVRQFIMKNLYRKPDNTFAWRLNIPAISKALPEIMGPIPLKGIHLSTFPVLFMRGEFSNYIGPEQIAVIKKYYPGALVKTISTAGHWIHADNPEEFIEVLNKFLLSQN
jgi:pimeloyl-ACP methyl ester carboxylesterase